MKWRLLLRKRVKRDFLRFPRKDQEYLKAAFHRIAIDPYSGDAQKMRGEENTWRRRIGAYRIFYELRERESVIFVYRVKRRTSKTY